ncbi:mucin-3B-like isoform X2 [Periplaneta americana]|uniref:G-protein coupled receptors family 1 profile domain-containing protein n=2 Tax=Periplaneta americana TaxID=6978 RepID=A0ABQ8SJ73_PERAM|nr:hypothetical protein ANN_16174 [Periplaneta americana]
MLPGPLCWLLGTLLLTGGVLASLYLIWLQIRRGVTGFSLLATSDALATIAISIAFLLNAPQHSDNATRTEMKPKKCNAGQLALASALFIVPFINTFVSMVAHTAENSHSTQMDTKSPRGWRVTTSPRLASSVAAQWLIPIVSALLLLSANVRHSRPYRSEDETCISGTAMIPMTVETTEQCLQQEDISDYIATIMNSPNYSYIHNQATINSYRHEAVNNSDMINNETSSIVNKIYSIVMESLEAFNQTRNQNIPSLSLRNRRAVGENRQTFTQSENTQNESDYGNYYNSDNDATYYVDSDEDFSLYHGIKDEVTNPYSSNTVTNADTESLTDSFPTTLSTTQHEPNTPITDSMPLIETNNEYEELTEASESDFVISSIPPDPTQTKIASPPVAHTTLIRDDVSILHSEEEFTTTTNYQDLSDTETVPPTSVSSESSPEPEATENEEADVTTSEFITQQTVSQIPMHIKTTVPQLEESSTPPQINNGLIQIQIPDTVNMCVVKCYFSGSFLKKYLFILLFLCYFVPIAISLVIFVATHKSLNMKETDGKVKPTEEPSTTRQDTTEILSCNMHLAKMISASKTVKQFIITSILLWTPTFIETLLRVWFCVNTPEWLITLLFLLGQTHTIIRNVLNIRLIRSYACSGTIEPSEGEQDKANHDIPKKLFTKVKAAFLP